jgi:alpha-2-macroglobulin
LPAGFEVLNPALALTGDIPQDPAGQAAQWFEQQNLRDERAEAFTSLLMEGVYHYAYVARATTPGVFLVPPVKVEEMYHPDTFGRSASERLLIQ